MLSDKAIVVYFLVITAKFFLIFKKWMALGVARKSRQIEAKKNESGS